MRPFTDRLDTVRLALDAGTERTARPTDPTPPRQVPTGPPAGSEGADPLFLSENAPSVAGQKISEISDPTAGRLNSETAFEEGRLAYGRGENSNPYQDGSEAADVWLKGWGAALCEETKLPVIMERTPCFDPRPVSENWIDANAVRAAAFVGGGKAHKGGLGMDANPHEVGSEAAVSWSGGWYAGFAGVTGASSGSSARESGRLARCAGEHRSSNPYRLAPSEYGVEMAEWYLGWDGAEKSVGFLHISKLKADRWISSDGRVGHPKGCRYWLDAATLAGLSTTRGAEARAEPVADPTEPLPPPMRSPTPVMVALEEAWRQGASVFEEDLPYGECPYNDRELREAWFVGRRGQDKWHVPGLDDRPRRNADTTALDRAAGLLGDHANGRLSMSLAGTIERLCDLIESERRSRADTDTRAEEAVKRAIADMAGVVPIPKVLTETRWMEGHLVWSGDRVIRRIQVPQLHTLPHPPLNTPLMTESVHSQLWKTYQKQTEAKREDETLAMAAMLPAPAIIGVPRGFMSCGCPNGMHAETGTSMCRFHQRLHNRHLLSPTAVYEEMGKSAAASGMARHAPFFQREQIEAWLKGYDSVALGPVGMDRTKTVAPAVLEAKDAVAGHVFVGVGSDERCSDPACGRYWSEIKDCDESHVDKPGIAHSGGLSAHELSQIKAKREADDKRWSMVF